MKLDIKSLAIGIASCLILTLTFGYTNTYTGETTQLISTGINWAMAVPSDGKVLARGVDGKAFIIDVDTAEAFKVEFDPRKSSVMNEVLILAEQK